MNDRNSAYRVRAQVAGSSCWPIVIAVGGVTLVLQGILFAAVGVPWAPERAVQPPIEPTRLAPTSTPTAAPIPSPTLPRGVVLLPSASPAGPFGATFPQAIPMISEHDDPVDDIEYEDCGDTGSCRTTDPPVGAPGLDITRIEAWIDHGILHAEVLLAGGPPPVSDTAIAWRVSLSLRRGDTVLDAPVCSGDACGSWFVIPTFSSSVARRAHDWTVSWQIDLDERDDLLEGPAAPGEMTSGGTAQGLEVLAVASASWGTRWSSDNTADEDGNWLTVPGLPSSCPPGSDPDVPGPPDQARPSAELMSMTFDREGRQIVLLGVTAQGWAETWTFDVCTNTWTASGAAGAPDGALLVYDRDSRAVVAFGRAADDGPTRLRAWVLKRATGAWERRAAAPIRQLLGVVYEPRSGQVVVHGGTAEAARPELWAYDVDRDAWARLREIDPPDLGADPQHELLAYDPRRSRIVLHLIDRSWEYNPATGRWSTDPASSPPVNGGFFGVPGAIATDATGGRVLIYADGKVLAYEGSARGWMTVWAPEPSQDGQGGGFGQSIVDDAVNRRMVVYGGLAAFPCRNDDGVRAFDPAAGTWSVLVPRSTGDVRVSGGDNRPDGSGRSPWIPAAKVRLHGDFFQRVPGVADGPWTNSPAAAPATLVDGLLVPECQLWTEGTVWWEETTSDPGSRAWVEVDLGGTFALDGAVVQADVNDEYLLSYRDRGSGTWKLLWSVPTGSAGGMATRPAQGDPRVRWSISEPVVTDALRFEATGGDAQYSVSEIAVFGREAP